MPTRLALAAALMLSTAPMAHAEMPQQSRRDQQLFACADDMARLCPGQMSASKKLKTCIRRKRTLVSATCRAWLDVPPK